MQETSRKIRNYVLENANAGGTEISDSDSLIQRNMIDSLAMLGLIGFLESEFNIKIKDDDVVPENFDSIQRITELVQSKLA